MNKLTNKNKTTDITRTLGAATLLASALSFQVTANPDERYEDYEPHHPSRGGIYEEPQPFKVYVNIRTHGRQDRYEDHRDRRRSPRDARRPSRNSNEWRSGADMYKSITMRKLARDLPHNILLVDSPSYADMVVKVRQTGFDLNFRITDIDKKDKKYKRDRRFTGGRCGVHHRAFYTRVEEKAEAKAFYSIRYDLKGLDIDHDNVRLKTSEKFRYGQNLTASTNCGIRPTNHVPSNGVAKLFNQAHPGYRNHVATEVRSEAAEELGRKLAHKIRSGAKHYYADMARRYEYGEYHENGYHHSDYKPKLAAVIASIILD
ncbi:MAG: hypothetical protein AB3N28_15290 [Kordiimonas sp.]